MTQNQQQIVNIFIMDKKPKKRKMNPKSLRNLKPRVRPIKNITKKVKLLPAPKKKEDIVTGFFKSTGRVLGGMMDGAGHYVVTAPYTKDRITNLNAKKVKK